jgi:protein TonB
VPVQALLIAKLALAAAVAPHAIPPADQSPPPQSQQQQQTSGDATEQKGEAPVMTQASPTSPPAPPAPPAPPPPAPSPPWRKLVARTPLDSLFSAADYPSSALHAHQAGTVQVGLDVGADGRVSRCWILKSSGVAALDVATCRLTKSRGRFTPATDGSGNPIPAQTTFTRSWRLPN